MNDRTIHEVHFILKFTNINFQNPLVQDSKQTYPQDIIFHDNEGFSNFKNSKNSKECMSNDQNTSKSQVTSFYLKMQL